jgi:initiation factor 1A
MVRNLSGGTKTKGLARKHQVKSNNGHIRLPQCEEERFAYVSKMLGNGMCEIYISEKDRLIGHIRNKFRGRNKRHNMITTQSIVLIGLRSWESVEKNCDILCIYDDNEISQLKNRPGIGIEEIIKMQLSQNAMTETAVNDDIDFINEIDETDDTTQSISENTKKTEESFANDKNENDLDLDDI